MIYMGSKNRISKYIVPIIQSYITQNTVGYIEPFVGGGNIIDKIQCHKKIGSDIDKYVIAVLKGLSNGEIPPLEVSKELYQDIKQNPSNYNEFLVGYVGYELSFGAKWFGGYVARSKEKCHGDIYSYKSCMKQALNLKNIDFHVCSFNDYKKLSGYVIYCDPPYKDTTKYKNSEFDYELFYEWCRKMSQHNIVLISEYTMPNDFICIWEKQTNCTIDSKRTANNEKNIRTEKLFIIKGET